MYVDLKAEHGDIVAYRLGFYKVIFLARPDAIQHVLRDNPQNYRKTVFYDLLKPLVGMGLLTSDGEFWRRQRRLSQPSFHKPRLEEFGQVMVASTRRMLAEWENKDQVELRHEMMNLTLDVVTRSLLGTGVEAETAKIKEAFTVGLDHVMDKLRALVPLPESIPTSGNRRFNRAMKNINEVVSFIIEKRRKETAPASDLLNSLLKAKDDETQETMTEQQLKDEVITMFLAGQETTAMGLCWTWYLLSQHPHVEERIREELATVLGGREPAPKDLPQLKYLACVINESMRLYPPAWWYGRTPIKDDVICGHKINAGTILTIVPYVTHRDPAYWKDPEVFDPLRFSSERGEKYHPYAYLPFAAGPRMCIGKDFALYELHLTLAMVMQKFRLTRTSSAPVRMDPGITLRPRDEIWATLERLPT